MHYYHGASFFTYCRYFAKNFKKGIAKHKTIVYNSSSSQEIALSPNGKATDSDSVISRFESL